MYFLFAILGLLAGRFSALLAETVSKDGYYDRKLFPLFLECQKKWGYLPLSWPIKILQNERPPLRPFLLEILMAGLFVSLFHFVSWEYVLIEYLLFIFALVTASTIDMEHMVLPDFFTLSGIVIGLLGAILNPETGRDFLPSLAGVLMGGGFLWFISFCYYLLRKEEGLGGGDIKLIAWIGAVLTWRAVPFVILLSCFVGVIASLFSLLKSHKSWLKQGIPFGPYLSFSAIIYIFYGQELSRIYLSFLYL